MESRCMCDIGGVLYRCDIGGVIYRCEVLPNPQSNFLFVLRFPVCQHFFF